MNTFSRMAEDWLRQQVTVNTQPEEITPAEVPIDEEWGLWMLARCVYRDRCWGGVGALHLDLARWCADHGRPVLASRRAFVAALQAEGFEVTADGFVYGLMLARDLEVYERYQVAPAGSGQPSRARLDAQPYPLPVCNAYRAAQRAGNEASL